MDTKKDKRIVKCGTMAENRQEQLIVGAKQLRKALQNGRVLSVYLAANADPAVTEPITRLCEAQSLPITWVKTMAELGRACGIDVGATAAATLKSV